MAACHHPSTQPCPSCAYRCCAHCGERAQADTTACAHARPCEYGDSIRLRTTDPSCDISRQRCRTVR